MTYFDCVECKEDNLLGKDFSVHESGYGAGFEISVYSVLVPECADCSDIREIVVGEDVVLASGGHRRLKEEGNLLVVADGGLIFVE